MNDPVFRNPKPGDRVVVWPYLGRYPNEGTIARVTATQIVLCHRDGDTKQLHFMRASGHEVANGFCGEETAEPWTPAVDRRVAERKTAEELEARVKGLRQRAQAIVADADVERRASPSLDADEGWRRGDVQRLRQWTTGQADAFATCLDRFEADLRRSLPDCGRPGVGDCEAP